MILILSVAIVIVGTSVDEADIRKLYGLNIIAIKHDGDMIIKIRPEYIFEKMILWSFLEEKRR